MTDHKRKRGDTDFGSSMTGVSDKDLARGFTDAAPEGSYEGSSEPPETCYEEGSFNLVQRHRGPRREGQIEPDEFVRNHGEQDEYGFVRRPRHLGDVERE